MSGLHLPPEILDSIVDLLHGNPETLKKCCLVPKSFVHRTRTHLFRSVTFVSATDLEAWKKTFPNTANSPAYYTRLLWIGCLEVITTADGEEGGWIRPFTNVVTFKVWNSNASWDILKDPLAPFHNFSPVLKALHIAPTTRLLPCVFSLVCSFPPLEDLTIMSDDHDDDQDEVVFQPSNSPALTGTLVLLHGLKYVIPRLLTLPDGLHFRRIMFRLYVEGDLQLATALVRKCSNTFECVEISRWVQRTVASINFSKATKLKQAAFRLNGFNIAWVTAALNTITSEHQDFQQIKISFPFRLSSIDGESADIARRSVGEVTYSQWMDLDRTLVRLWESHVVCIRFTCSNERDLKGLALGFIGGFLPEITKRGIVQLADFVEFG